ncbi:MAG TPA: hypothetical protein VMW38_02520, partial [Terriglobia bacterium]|nr:hypothetical protein [Terriglobia bacterium]
HPGRPPRGRRSRAPAADGALGYCLPPPAGLNKEEAASCRFTNVQSPVLAFQAKGLPGHQENLNQLLFCTLLLIAPGKASQFDR